MKQLRVLLLFILFFLLGGGTAYAQSVGDEAATPHPAVRQEAVSVPGKNEARASSEQAADKKISKPVQETLASQDEKSKQVEPAAVETPEAEKDVTLEAEAVDGEKQAAPEKQEDALGETSKTETAEEKEQVISDDKEEADDEKSANDLSKEGDSPVEADQEEKVKPEESEANETEAEEAETDAVDKTEKTAQKGEVLEKGTFLDPQVLKANVPAEETKGNVKKVSSFKDLKQALEDAEDGVETTIVVTTSFEISETLTIGENKIITLTSEDGKVMDKEWDPIKQPKDYDKKGEKKQREIIDEGRKRGEKAIKDAEKNVKEKGDGSYHYNFEENKENIVLKRAADFITMFNVKGKLTLGDKDNSINFDGNEIAVGGSHKGTFFDVQTGGNLVLNNGVIANGRTTGEDYNSPIRVREGATFTMNGGRITSNMTKANPTVPYNAGAVDVSRGGHFIMKNGMIDHNISASGAVFVGNDGLSNSKILKEDKDFALFEFNGGSIVSNKSKGYNLAGGIAVFPTGKLNITGGIVANNYAGRNAGGIMVSDQYVRSFSNTINNSYSNTHDDDYDEYVQKNKAEANFDGGLIYKNETGYAGGGVFVDSNNVNFNKTMILDNKAAKFGGGVYVGFPPRVQELENVLITENKTLKSAIQTNNDEAWGGPLVGGGIWNCPDGYIHLGDGHSVYVFNNNSGMGGADYVFAKKTYNFKLNDDDISGQFYTFISPVTKEKNIIKFLNDSGKGSALPKNMSYTTDKFVYLKAIYDEALQREAWKNSGTFILGNQASYGAGLGSDASMKSTQDIGDVEFKFKKQWDEEIDEDDYRLKNIHADIYIVPKDVDEIYVRSQYGYDNHLYKYGEVVLNYDNNWEAIFGQFKNDKYKNLPAYTMEKGLPFTSEELAKRGLKYLVIERETDYISEVEQVENESNSFIFTLKNRPYAEAKIEKKWKMLTEEEIREALGEDREDVEVKNRELPDQVTFYVLNDGKKIIVDYKRDENGKVYPVYKTVTVTKKNDWKGVITKLDPKLLAKGAYGIKEKDLDGFEMSYEIKKVLVNEDELKAYEEKLKEGNPIQIEFYFRRYWTHHAVEDVKKENSISNNPFKAENGDVTYNLYVDGKKVESKTATWQPKANGKGYWLDDENIVFGQDPDKKIVIDGKWKPVKVVHYNFEGDVSTIKNPEINMYLKKDENGVYSLYLPYILENGQYVDLFYLEETVGNGNGRYETIYDLNPEAKPLAEFKPIYEYVFVATNKELPPEKPPEEPKEPPEEPPKEPPEEPEESPKEPPEEPEEPPVTPPEEPEEPEELPGTSPDTEEVSEEPAKKPGGSPQTGVGSVAPYMLLALTSSMGLGYTRRKKH